MKTVTQLIAESRGRRFSFEVLPPLKGKGIDRIYAGIDALRQWDPMYINITTHRSEIVYKDTPDGLYKKESVRSRPGTVAVAAAIQQRYGIPAVPHLICSGYTKAETEYALIDLNFLGINNLLLLRGDKAKHESRFTPQQGGHAHASDLQLQVNDFNGGYFIDGTKMDIITGEQFSYGVAGYPEKHDEAPNLDMDIQMLKHKVDNGAQYVVTQMFFDNAKYYDFVARCRQAGITVPIVPGIKPIVSAAQITLLPKVFHVDFPTELAIELSKCTTPEAIKAVGAEWCIAQVRDLLANGAPSIHFYSMNATPSVVKVAEAVY